MIRLIPFLVIVLLSTQTVYSTDVKSMQKLIVKWNKQNPQLKENNSYALFVTSVFACSMCGQSGFNALMKKLNKERPNINRVIVIVDADNIELPAYKDLYPYTNAIVAAKSKEINKALSIEVYPTFYLASATGEVLFKLEDVTHNLPKIDSILNFAESSIKNNRLLSKNNQKVVDNLFSASKKTNLSVSKQNVKIHINRIRKINEKAPLVQIGTITYPNEINKTAYMVDLAQNSILKLDITNATIDNFYKVENKLEYWYKTDTLSSYIWADGYKDTIDHWKEFQQQSALSQIKSVHADSLKLLVFCRLHTGIIREMLAGQKRLLWQVGHGIVNMDIHAVPENVNILSVERYKPLPPIIVLSNGEILSRIFWEGYYEGIDKPSNQQIQDSAAIFSIYSQQTGKMMIAYKSSVFFNEDIDDENTRLFPDDKAGFFCLSREYKWFFHAIPDDKEFKYDMIDPKGIWITQNQNILCYDCFYSDGNFYIVLSLDTGELWIQRYNITDGIFFEKQLKNMKKNVITQLKIIKNGGVNFSILAKFQTTRWHLIDVQL